MHQQHDLAKTAVMSIPPQHTAEATYAEGWQFSDVDFGRLRGRVFLTLGGEFLFLEDGDVSNERIARGIGKQFGLVGVAVGALARKSMASKREQEAAARQAEQAQKSMVERLATSRRNQRHDASEITVFNRGRWKGNLVQFGKKKLIFELDKQHDGVLAAWCSAFGVTLNGFDASLPVSAPIWLEGPQEGHPSRSAAEALEIMRSKLGARLPPTPEAVPNPEVRQAFLAAKAKMDALPSGVRRVRSINKFMFVMVLICMVLSIAVMLGMFTSNDSSSAIVTFGIVIAQFIHLLLLPKSNKNLLEGKRTTQTVLAVMALPWIPFGTIYGLYALYVCWSSGAEHFEPNPG